MPLTSTLNELLGNSPVLTGLPISLGSKLNSVVSNAEIIRNNLTEVGNNSATLINTPTNLVNALNNSVDDVQALIQGLVGLNNPNVDQLVGALNGVANDLTAAVSSINQGSVPSAQALTASLSPVVKDLDGLINNLLGNSQADSVIDQFAGNNTLVGNLVGDLGNSIDSVAQTVDTITKKLLGAQEDLLKNGISSPQGLTGSLTDAVNDVQKLSQALLGRTGEGATKLVNGLQELGGSLNQTIADVNDGSIPSVDSLLGQLNPRVDDLQDLSTAILTGKSAGGTGGTNGGGTNGGGTNGGGTNGGTNSGTNGGTNSGTSGGTNSGTNGGTNGGTNSGTNGGTNSGTNGGIGTTPTNNPNAAAQPTTSNLIKIGTNKRDTLTGGDGNDMLVGMDKRDVLVGGKGADTFGFARTSGKFARKMGADFIQDFQHGLDKIALNKSVFGLSGSGLSFATVKKDSKMGETGAQIVYSKGSRSLFYDKNGDLAGLGGGGKFAVVQSDSFLTKSDFTVVKGF